jgi:hypothetical protein
MFQFVCRSSRAVGVLFLSIGTINLAFSQGTSVASLTSSGVNFRTNGPPKSELTGASEPSTILARFVAAETKVREALNQHTFKRDVVLQTIGPNGEVTGEYIRNSQFLFDDRGNRIEHILFHPKPTIREMRITKEDIQDLAGGQLLGIDIVEATKYRLSYAGSETVASRQLFAIDVTPLAEPNPRRMSERFFSGRVWVDPTTFQIVKIKGIVEPQGKQRFPIFETWREPIKNALALPTRTEADDVLHFLDRDVHYRIKVRYYDYKLFGSKVSIIELDEPGSNMNEAPPREKEAPPKTDGASRKRNEASPKIKETPAKISAIPPSQLPLPAIAPAKKAEVCTTNRNAPPTGAYHWPADSEVKVYFFRNMFTPEQSSVLLDAMKTWTMANQEIGSGVKFIYAGETDSRMNCESCLTVTRRAVLADDKHHYAFFNPMKQDEGRLLVSAWIDLDFGIKDPKALQGFMAHELGHGLGLWDCPSCKSKRSLMNSFPGLNKNNGLVAPSSCDLATMRNIYQEERQIAAAKSYGNKRPETVRTVSASAFPPLGLEKARSSVLDGRPLVVGAEAAESSGERRPEKVRAGSAFALPSLGLDKPSFSVFDAQRPHLHRSLFFWGGIF